MLPLAGNPGLGKPRTQHTVPFTMPQEVPPQSTMGQIPLSSQTPLPLQLSQIGSQDSLQQMPLVSHNPTRQSALLSQLPPSSL
jgi:hypothetical protein